MTQKPIRKALLWIVITTLVIFLIEIITPQGVGESILYVAVILIGLSSKNKRMVYVTLVLSILLTIIGYFISPPSIEPWKSITNRSFAITLFWVVALVGLKRIQVEENLFKSEERYRNVLDNLMEGAQIIGFDWKYFYINAVAAKQGHQTRENLIGQTMMDVYPGIEHTHLFSVLKNCMQERTTYQMENKFTYPDGTTGWFELSIQPIEEGLFILSNDITKRKQAEAQLYELNMELEQRILERTNSLEESLRLISSLYEVVQSVVHFNNLPDMLQSLVSTVSHTLSADRVNIIIFNHETKQVTHLVKSGPGDQNAIENTSYEEFMDGLSGWALRELKPAISPNGKPDSRESPQVQQRRIEANCGSIAVFPLLYLDGVLGTLTVVNRPDQPDFTTQEINWMEAIATQAALAIGRVQVYAQLNQSEEVLRLASWATKDAIWDWDLQTNQIQWGIGLQKMFNYPVNVIETSYEWRQKYIHPDDKAKVEHSLQQVLDHNMEFWSKEYRFQRMDKTYADVMDRGYVLRDETGIPYRMIGAMMDITEQKKAEQALQEFNNKLTVTLKEIEQRNNEIDLLNTMLSQLHRITLDLLKLENTNQLLDNLVKSSAAFLDASFVEIMLAENDGLIVRATTQESVHLLGQQMSREDAILSWQAYETRQPVVINDYSTWQYQRDIYKDFSLHAVATFPILNNEKCMGVLGVARNKLNYEFTKDQIQFGSLFASVAALIITNTQLREMLKQQSIRDPLTGLFNRRYMEETIQREIKLATRQLHPLGIIMLDIDYFKRFNDTYGHAVGDKLLREVARFLQSQIRGEDIACRYGGEEFILIMPDAHLETVQTRAEILREGIKNIKLEEVEQGVTLSVGVAMYPQHGRNMDEVIHAADIALYQAKQNGRNQVIVTSS